jgi:hypothetical protein
MALVNHGHPARRCFLPFALGHHISGQGSAHGIAHPLSLNRSQRPAQASPAYAGEFSNTAVSGAAPDRLSTWVYSRASSSGTTGRLTWTTCLCHPTAHRSPIDRAAPLADHVVPDRLILISVRHGEGPRPPPLCLPPTIGKSPRYCLSTSARAGAPGRQTRSWGRAAMGDGCPPSCAGGAPCGAGGSRRLWKAPQSPVAGFGSRRLGIRHHNSSR